MRECVHRCHRSRRSELWPPRYSLVHLFHSHTAQPIAAVYRASLPAPQVAPRCASPLAVAYFISCLPFVVSNRAAIHAAFGCGQAVKLLRGI
ncbi:jg2797 [Pararge aegeria aegeria]|uniref:Jg2797 protein n=1 Tax=Pararge aegeria aegeria TaxID=348720 RepID=A0A8S4R3U7_9NEOP|nr:jg2797 [Pararge aegeria aegeria]